MSDIVAQIGPQSPTRPASGTAVVVRPLRGSDRRSAGEVLAAAFPDKLAAKVGDWAALAETIGGRPPRWPWAPSMYADFLHEGTPPSTWVAVVDGDVAGVVEVRDRAVPVPRRKRWRILRRSLGRRRAARAWLFDVVFHSGRPGADELFLKTLAVAPRSRGRGVGSALVRHVREEARRRGKAAVTLYCIDRNDGARRLYRRLGFGVVRRSRLGPLRHLLGFAAADLMRARVAENERRTTGSPARHPG